jgi:hypothetical protein
MERDTYGNAEPITEAESQDRARDHHTYTEAWEAILNDDGTLRQAENGRSARSHGVVACIMGRDSVHICQLCRRLQPTTSCDRAPGVP